MTIATSRLRRRLGLALVLVAFVAASCGSNGDTEAAEPTTPPDAPGDSPGDDVDPPGEAGAPADFPVTIEHKYGETVIEAVPERVVSVGFAEHDGILALGVVPVGVRDWYGDQPFATWPWAQDELGDAEPAVLASTELDFEEIAALRPDLILGINSGMTDADYELLSQIAPTVAQSSDFVDWGTPWRETMRTAGRALGRNDVAEAIISDVESLFADTRAAHPEFEGATAAVAFQFDGMPGAYASGDLRAQFMSELGFVTPAEFDEVAGDLFYFSVSPEELPTLDADVIVWLSTTDETTGEIRDLALRPSLTAFQEGREILADPLLAGAFSHGNPLSFEYVIDELVPQLALAVDGDPSTPVPSAAALDPDGPDGGTDDPAPATELDDEAQAAADAWALVFDSETAFEEKASHLEDAATLESTIVAYGEAGSGMGGIALTPTAVTVDGTEAAITYDVLFGGTPAYSDQAGTVSLVDGTWTVSRDEFCSFMASARTPCP